MSGLTAIRYYVRCYDRIKVDFRRFEIVVVTKQFRCNTFKNHDILHIVSYIVYFISSLSLHSLLSVCERSYES